MRMRSGLAMTGPLSGRRIIELAGIGPAPFACMLLADMGADVIRIDRPGGSPLPVGAPEEDLSNRGKRSVVLDLKDPAGIAAAMALIATADAVVEGFRPGVAERLGLGPQSVWRHNPRAVYGRMTGWGQDGPLAAWAGHDIGYIAITGALHTIGPAGGPPQIPMNLLGDFGGGALYLAVGLLAAILEADRSGHGQVVDAAIVDGTAHLLAQAHTMLRSGQWTDERGVNLLDGGAPFYSVYGTSDGRFMAVGALEGKFFAELVRLLDVTGIDVAAQNDTATWPAMREVFTRIFASRTRDEWTAIFEGSDACVAPVMSLREAARHPHIAARGAVVQDDRGWLRPGLAPRFSWHQSAAPGSPPSLGADTREVLAGVGVDADALIDLGVAIQADR
jgi:alpha-methylacyl-CoA racemase